MKILVIADLHNKVHWVEKCIAEVSPDLTVFLGDYFDSFDDSHEITRETAQWLKESLDKPNRIHLLGNHDMPYRFPMNMSLLCPGFTHEKSIIIDDSLRAGGYWEKIKSFHWVDGWLLSHAGINLSFLHPLKGFDLNDLCKVEEESLIKCSAGVSTPLYGCGFSRGGGMRCGGITWQDFNVDFVPIEDLNQIVGHTPHRMASVKLIIDDDIISCTWDEYLSNYEKDFKKSLNIDIDTHRRHYAIIENGKVHVVQNTFATEQDFKP